MAKKAKKRMAKARLRTRDEEVAREQRDLLGRNVRRQKEIRRLARQLISQIGRTEQGLVELLETIGERIGYTATPNVPNASEQTQ